ncbi:tellurite resistance TerB C-terminal domain-containing protein [Algoriphagus aquimarinus]|uniref:SH3 domain-containing protein n=1 Tax=Algoriphagus aquimarinus TaxID=237018 RepID=A0A1I1BJV2_9BACT|nr:tellurite resistance TerB C-terminal domain-containing protein [Algoriphagus aquimarinus]SFB50664.1 SH3 domain-containing protein [Algoriphagus aquimarinus]
MKVLINTLIFLLILFFNTRVVASEIYEVTSDVFVRSGIGTSNEPIGVAKSGDQVKVLDKSNANWYKIEFEEKVGYISSKFVRFVEPVAPDPVEEVPVMEEKESYPFAGVLIIFFALFLILEITRRMREKRIQKSIKNFQNSYPEFNIDKERKVEVSENTLLRTLSPSLRKLIDSQLINSVKSGDDSIIDVTNESPSPVPKNDKRGFMQVPTWNHKYIYSKSDLNSATSEQKIFYYHFKQKFLNGTSLDLLGNTNYAFVLLFDLLDDYRNHQNFNLLESQIISLGNNYYKTRSYGVRFLNDIKKELGIQSGFAGNFTSQKIEIKPADEFYYEAEPDYIYWKVGSKYKEKLGLNEEEVKLLNKLWESTTNFCGVEFCYFQVIRLYLDTIAAFAKQCEKSGSTLENEFLIVSDLIARKIFGYRNGSANYKMSVKNTSDELYSTIFKLCENAVREHYGHKRKLSAEIRYAEPLITEHFKAKISVPFSNVINKLIVKIPEPDEATQKELNALNTSRWKDEFQSICDNFLGDEKRFVEDIKRLGDLNAKNPSIENIFFEASKYIASKHKESSLILYIHYLHYDLQSAKFDNKRLAKTIQKNLFKSQEQVEQFEVIVNDFLKYQNLDKAISAISELYAVKRKRIKLDRNSIEEVRQQHAGTVELLNEFLNDEEEDGEKKENDMDSFNEEIEIHITSVKEEVSESPFLDEIEFKPIHYSALELFSKNNFSIPVSEIDSFAKANGVFRNQLIDSINEACYELLDDVLIEEEEDFYTIEAMYFQTITNK